MIIQGSRNAAFTPAGGGGWAGLPTTDLVASWTSDVGVTTSGGRVTSWVDPVSLMEWTAPAQGPTFNAGAGLDGFDSFSYSYDSADGLFNNSLVSAPWAIYIVFKFDTFGSNKLFWEPRSPYHYYRPRGSNGGWRWYNGSTLDAAIGPTAPASDYCIHVISGGIIDGADNNRWSRRDKNTPFTLARGVSDIGTVYVGSYTTYAVSGFTLMAVSVYGKNHSYAEADAVMDAYKLKYPSLPFT